MNKSGFAGTHVSVKSDQFAITDCLPKPSGSTFDII
jgi:hypothetical protein